MTAPALAAGSSLSDGAVISHTVYDPWGNPLTATYPDANFAGIDNRSNYTGYTWDEVLELYFAQNRFYDAETHRFTQEDTVKDGSNWYVYCANSPLVYMDWLGEAATGKGPVMAQVLVPQENGTVISIDAYFVNGETRYSSSHKRMENGAYVYTAGGWYMMVGESGVSVVGMSVALPSGATQTGVIINGDLYLPDGTKAPAGSVVNGKSVIQSDGSWRELTNTTSPTSQSSLGSWTAADPIEDIAWGAQLNSWLYRENTNCYSYAANMLVNPLTEEMFPKGGMQPGMLSNQIDHVQPTAADREKKTLYLSGTPEGNAYLVDLIVADLAMAELSFLPYSAGMTGGYKVALVVNPGIDYHLYRESKNGTWSHKQGSQEIIQLVGYHEDFFGDLRCNTTPLSEDSMEANAAKIGYTEFIGYFYIKQIN